MSSLPRLSFPTTAIYQAAKKYAAPTLAVTVLIHLFVLTAERACGCLGEKDAPPVHRTTHYTEIPLPPVLAVVMSTACMFKKSIWDIAAPLSDFALMPEDSYITPAGMKMLTDTGRDDRAVENINRVVNNADVQCATFKKIALAATVNVGKKVMVKKADPVSRTSKPEQGGASCHE